MPDQRLAWYRDLQLVLTGATSYTARCVANVVGAEPERLAGFDELPSGVAILHLAAATDPKASSTLEENLRLDFDAVRAVNRLNGTLIYASGNNVYGLGEDKDLSEAAGRSDYYGTSKRVGEVVVRSLCERPFAILRVADVFGVGQRRGNFFRALERCLKGREEITLIGSGAKRRSYIYGPELARFILHVREVLDTGSAGEVLNLGYPDAMSLREIAERVAAVSGLNLRFQAGEGLDEAADVRTMVPGPLLGYHWRWSLESALDDYVVSCSAPQ